MKLILMALAALLMLQMSLSSAWSQCSKEEMEEKARIVALKMKNLRNKDQYEYQRILLRFNNKALLLDPNDTQAWCDLYDQLLFEI